jgi:hypothetical protein
MRTYIAMLICLLLSALFVAGYHVGELRAVQTLSFIGGTWLFTGWWLAKVLKKRLTEVGRYQTKPEPLPGVAQVMFGGGILVALISLAVRLGS